MKFVVAICALFAALASPASAHVFVQSGEAKAGASYRAVLAVPHGCEGAPTTRISVRIPEGLIAVKPMPKPGWTLETKTAAYEKEYPFMHGTTLKNGVKEITWSGELRDDFYDEFVFTAFLAERLPAAALYLPTEQSCGEQIVQWSEHPAAGESAHDLAHPAPMVRVAQSASQQRTGSLQIVEPWVRATPGGAKIGGGYVTITNSGSSSDRLTGGTLNGAGRVEIHEMKMEGDIMRMRPLADGLEIKPGETVKLQPNGYHFMFMDLQQPLKQGETVKGTLNFEKAGAVPVQFDVLPVGSSGVAHHH